MTRDEHIAWCKVRAIEELNYSGKPSQALISIMSDLKKHKETRNHAGIQLTAMLMLGGFIQTREQAIKHIEGFN